MIFLSKRHRAVGKESGRTNHIEAIELCVSAAHLSISEKNFIIPSSSINKCLGLRLILFADVIINLKIIALRIKWRVDITQINRVIFELIPQNSKLSP